MKNKDVLNYLDPVSEESLNVTKFTSCFRSMITNIEKGNVYSLDEGDDRFHQDFIKLRNIARNLHTDFIPYSEITRITYTLKDNAGMDTFILLFKKQISNCISKESNNSQDISNEYVILIKLSEHVQLAIKQKDILYRQQDRQICSQERTLDQLNKNTDKERRNLKKLKKELKSLKDMKSSVYGDFIAILGIFSALIFSLFGGFSTLSRVVSQVSKYDRLYRILISSSLMGMILLSLLFFLLKAIATMSGKSISTSLEKNVFKKYPFFMATMIFLIIIFCLGAAVDLFYNN